MTKIFAICITLDAGTDYDREKLLSSGIKIGDKIELKAAYVYDCCTDIYLVGYKDSFNSVFFDFVDEDGDEYDIYDDPDFRTY